MINANHNSFVFSRTIINSWLGIFGCDFSEENTRKLTYDHLKSQQFCRGETPEVLLRRRGSEGGWGYPQLPGHASPPEIPGSATGCSKFSRSLCYLLQPPLGPSCLEVHCQQASLQCAFAFTLGVKALVKASNRDPACIRDPASNRSFTVPR